MTITILKFKHLLCLVFIWKEKIYKCTLLTFTFCSAWQKLFNCALLAISMPNLLDAILSNTVILAAIRYRTLLYYIHIFLKATAGTNYLLCTTSTDRNISLVRIKLDISFGSIIYTFVSSCRSFKENIRNMYMIVR